MHERDTRSTTVAEPAGTVRAAALRPAEAAVLKLQREVGNRVTAGIVSSKLGRPRADQRPPGAGDFAKLLGDQAATFGQFSFTHALARGLDKAMEPHLRELREEDRTWLRSWLDYLEGLMASGHDKAAAEAVTKIKTAMQDRGEPGAAIIKLMGDPAETGVGFGGALYTKLWKEYGKPGAATPDVTKHLTYAKLAGLRIYENIACKETTERLGAKVGAGRGGEGRRTPGTVIAKGTSIASDIKRDDARSNDLTLGDVVVYGNDLGKWVKRMRDALDDGWTVHARCISGTHGRGKGGRDPDHSILIYGHGGTETETEFYSFDPDVSGTGGLTPGWGRIYYDADARHLSTAKTASDFRTYSYSTDAEDEAGSAAGRESDYQRSGVHRYQVKEIWTM
jgi:hypothetical protein